MLYAALGCAVVACVLSYILGNRKGRVLGWKICAVQFANHIAKYIDNGDLVITPGGEYERRLNESIK